MSKETLYTTQSKMEAFAVSHYRATGERLSIRELAEKMNEHGLLQTARPPRPILNWSMSKEEFNQALLDLPVNATRILESEGVGFSDLFREEKSAFPPGQDVFCRKAMPCRLPRKMARSSWRASLNVPRPVWKTAFRLA